MVEILAGFVIFALVVFCVCCIYAAFALAEGIVSARYYKALRESMREAIEEIEARWDGEPVPAETVTEILIYLHNRRVCIPFDQMRERQGGGA